MARSLRRAASAPAPDSTLPEARSARDRILAAAMHLAQTEGLQGLTQARAAALAGLRQSHLTYYFPMRKDLIKALAEAIHAQMLQAMNAPVGGDARPTLDGLREFFAKRPCEPVFPRLMLALVATTDEDPSLRSWLVNFENQVLANLRAAFSHLGLEPSEDELGLFHATIVGSSILALHGGPKSADRSSRLICLAFDRLVHLATTQRRKKAPSTRNTSLRT